MLDQERLLKIIGDTEKYFKDLEELKIKSAESLSKERFYSVSMLLFAILNRAISLGEEIVRANRMGTPSSYKEIFGLLKRNKVISNDLEKKLEFLVSKRNVLAHEYQDITEESIYQLYVKIGAVKEFMESVKKHIRSKIK
ncbi:MAG: HepT-like ribonuclease domain-containing protein [Nanoarchaeota archaeon]